MKRSEIFWARWVTFAAFLMLLCSYFIINTPWDPWFSGLMGFVGAVITTAVLEVWARFIIQTKKESKVNLDFNDNNNMKLSLDKITINALRDLLQVHTEKEILEVVLQTGIEMLHANGVSFVPFDEWGKSLPALMHGKVPGTALQTWAQRLSMPETRQKCKNCEALHGDAGCILLASTTTSLTNVRCYPLSSSGREIGVINFYFDEEMIVPVEANSFFSEILESAAKALENLQSRDKEIAALLYLQTINTPKSDSSVLFSSLLENVQHAFDVDFVILYLPGGIPGQRGSGPELLSRTNDGVIEDASSIPDLAFLEGIWRSVLLSNESLSLENVAFNKLEKWKSLLAVPLAWRGEEPLGVLVLGSKAPQAIIQRHQALLETLAGQAALLLQNARLMVQVEYQAVVDERTRLAREIHDGLAQTLAFLKIQAAQMQNFMARGEMEKLTRTLQANYRTLSDAYIDARQAIDDLRRVPTTNLRDWIGQIALDFEQATNLKVEVFVAEFAVEYPANIQAQLIRIVQEALSNIRKHASANSVRIAGRQDGDYYMIEICDDGRGFDPESDRSDGISRYGLRGMRERSESIGADFQIISQQGSGTCVSLRVPVVMKEEI